MSGKVAAALGATGLTLLILFAPAALGRVSHPAILATPPYSGTTVTTTSTTSGAPGGCGVGSVLTAPSWSSVTGKGVFRDKATTVASGACGGSSFVATYVHGSAFSGFEIQLPVVATFNGSHLINLTWNITAAGNVHINGGCSPSTAANHFCSLSATAAVVAVAYLIDTTTPAGSLSTGAWVKSSAVSLSLSNSAGSCACSSSFSGTTVITLSMSGALVTTDIYVLDAYVVGYSQAVMYGYHQHIFGNAGAMVNMATAGNSATLTSILIA